MNSTLKRSVQKLALGIITVGLVAVVSTSSASPPYTGIKGHLTLHTTFGSPPDGTVQVSWPLTASFAVFSAHNQREVARVTSDSWGRYSVLLPPGRYVVVPEPVVVPKGVLTCISAAAPIEITVQPRRFTWANIPYQGSCRGTPAEIGDDDGEKVTSIRDAAEQKDQNHSSVSALDLGKAETSATAEQSVFQASLLTPPGGARVIMGRFYLRVDNNEAEFVALVFPFGTIASNLNPVLSVPGRSVEFSLGEGEWTEFRGLYSYADRNPFLPFEPPFVYDEYGNPYLIDAPVIRFGYLYAGSFRLPPGFERQLLTGRGIVEFNESISGSVAVAATDEPGKHHR